MRQAFDETIVITAHGYDKKFIEDFEYRFSQITGIISSHVNLLDYYLSITYQVFSMQHCLT